MNTSLGYKYANCPHVTNIFGQSVPILNQQQVCDLTYAEMMSDTFDYIDEAWLPSTTQPQQLTPEQVGAEIADFIMKQYSTPAGITGSIAASSMVDGLLAGTAGYVLSIISNFHSTSEHKTSSIDTALKTTIVAGLLSYGVRKLIAKG